MRKDIHLFLSIPLLGALSCTPAAKQTPELSPTPQPSVSEAASPVPAGQCQDNTEADIPYPAPGSSFLRPDNLVPGTPYLQVNTPNPCEENQVRVLGFEFTPGLCTTLTLHHQESGMLFPLDTHKVAGDTQVSFSFDTSTYPRGTYTLNLQNTDGSEQAQRETVLLPCNRPTPTPFTPTTEMTAAPPSKTRYLRMNPTSVCVGDEVTLSTALSETHTHAIYLERPSAVEGKIPPLYGEHVLLTRLEIPKETPTTYRFTLNETLQDAEAPGKSLTITPGEYWVHFVNPTATLGAGTLTVKNCKTDP